MACQDRLEQIDAHAVVVHGYAENTSTEGAKCLYRPQIGWYLNNNFVSWTEQEAADQPYALCRAGEDEDVLGIHCYTSFAHVRGNIAAQAL